MSDEPKNRSHTVRLAVSMVVGVLVGSIFVQMALPWTAAICTLGGAIGGLALELVPQISCDGGPKRRTSFTAPIAQGRDSKTKKT